MAASWRILEGDCRDRLAELDAGSVQTCVTSPPYFGLRDYGHNSQIGLEATLDEYVTALIGVFREIRRVLRDDGTVWLNLGDSYAGKQLLGIPWRVAFAMQQDGWVLRSDIIWNKPNPMPESVTDRPTKAHEYLFLLSKSAKYFYDADAIREDTARPDLIGKPNGRWGNSSKGARAEAAGCKASGGNEATLTRVDGYATRNRRSVWTVATHPYPGAHFATFPPKLVEPCILAGSRSGDVVLDPFAGSGTTGLVALRHDRSFIGIEANSSYVELMRRRIVDDAPLLNSVAERDPWADRHAEDYEQFYGPHRRVAFDEEDGNPYEPGQPGAPDRPLRVAFDDQEAKP